MSPNVFDERGGNTMPYRKPKPAPKCCICQSSLYGRSELPTDLLAICFLCLSDCPDWNGAVLNRAGTSRVAA
jgi:hypothetical protein